MNCKLMVYKVKTVKRGNVDINQLRANVDNANK